VPSKNGGQPEANGQSANNENQVELRAVIPLWKYLTKFVTVQPLSDANHAIYRLSVSFHRCGTKCLASDVR